MKLLICTQNNIFVFKFYWRWFLNMFLSLSPWNVYSSYQAEKYPSFWVAISQSKQFFSLLPIVNKNLWNDYANWILWVSYLWHTRFRYFGIQIIIDSSNFVSQIECKRIKFIQVFFLFWLLIRRFDKCN